MRPTIYPRKAACWDQSCYPSGGGGGHVDVPQLLSINGYQLSISNGNTVTLPAMGGGGGGGTDSQTLSFNGTSRLLTISNGNSVTISAQALAWNSGTRQLSISGGNSVVIADTDTVQTLRFNTSTRALSISSGNSVTIPDAQSLSINGNLLTISNGNTVTLPTTGGGGGGGAPTFAYIETVDPNADVSHIQLTNKATYKFLGTMSANRTFTLGTPSDTTLGNSLKLSFFEFNFGIYHYSVVVGTSTYIVNSNSVLDFEYTSAGWKRVA